MSDTDKPMTGMALSMLDAPTRGEATLRDLRRYAAGIKDHNDRELVQHAADMLDVALRALRPEGREQEAKDAARYRWLRTYEPDLIILPQYVGHPLADGVREYASSAAELDAALDAAILLQRAPQEGSR